MTDRPTDRADDEGRAPYDPDPLDYGDVVRVRLSAECPGWGGWLDDDDDDGAPTEHDARFNGLVSVVTGIIDDSDCPEARDGHVYVVAADPSDLRWDADWYCRAELSRLEEP